MVNHSLGRSLSMLYVVMQEYTCITYIYIYIYLYTCNCIQYTIIYTYIYIFVSRGISVSLVVPQCQRGNLAVPRSAGEVQFSNGTRCPWRSLQEIIGESNGFVGNHQTQYEIMYKYDLITYIHTHTYIYIYIYTHNLNPIMFYLLENHNIKFLFPWQIRV